jgi:hypothetical protein
MTDSKYLLSPRVQIKIFWIQYLFVYYVVLANF